MNSEIVTSFTKVRARDLDGLPAVEEAIRQQSDVMQRQKGLLMVSGDGVFPTMQGEGESAGEPAIFLRLHRCNLKCTWCDTPETWHHNAPEFWTNSLRWTIEQTREAVEESWPYRNGSVHKRLVITGGEPLIQEDEVTALVEEMHDWIIEIETNGTVEPNQTLLDRCQINCSPKLKNSGMPESLRIRRNVLSTINTAKNSHFKFVVQEVTDLDEVSEIVSSTQLDPAKIIIMPEAITPEEIQATSDRVRGKVEDLGYRLMGRLQYENGFA